MYYIGIRRRIVLSQFNIIGLQQNQRNTEYITKEEL
jgi:hypothetical protein